MTASKLKYTLLPTYLEALALPPHILQKPEGYVGKAFVNEKGNAECVEFIRQTLKAPPTALWKEGKKVTKGDTSILRGAAIATFVNGVYPQSGISGMHAAIYLGQSATGIEVLDQWRAQGMVKARTIRWDGGPSLSNTGTAFSVIEW